MKDAGVPDGVYVNLFATHEQVAAMIADPRLHGVSLTGSERAGTVVAETAGRNLKKVVLELGGSDPYIILDTGNVEDAAKTAWVTRMEKIGRASCRERVEIQVRGVACHRKSRRQGGHRAL